MSDRSLAFEKSQAGRVHQLVLQPFGLCWIRQTALHLRDRMIEPGLLLRGRTLVFEWKWPVDLLDIDPAILDRLEGIGEFDQLARGGLRIGEGARGNELHATSPPR